MLETVEFGVKNVEFRLKDDGFWIINAEESLFLQAPIGRKPKPKQKRRSSDRNSPKTPRSPKPSSGAGKRGSRKRSAGGVGAPLPSPLAVPEAEPPLLRVALEPSALAPPETAEEPAPAPAADYYPEEVVAGSTTVDVVCTDGAL